MDPKNKIQVFQTDAELTEVACQLIIEIAQKAIHTRGKFIIALSGGHSPQKLYAAFSTLPFRDQIPWDKTFIFWGDERCVPTNDERNNAYMAQSLLLAHVAIPSSNIYPIPVELSPAEAAMEYEKTIQKFFQDETPHYDIILLGLGENGHTASIFPYTDVISENTRLIKEIYVAEQNMFRITMTANLINQAHHIVFLVTGKNKAKVLNQVLDGPYQPSKYPAQLIKPIYGRLYWFIDTEAAALLPG